MFKENVKYRFKSNAAIAAFKKRCEANIGIASKIRDLGKGAFTVKNSDSVGGDFEIYCNGIILTLERGRAVLRSNEFEYFKEIKEDADVPQIRVLKELSEIDNTCKAVKESADTVKNLIKATGVKFTQAEYLKAVQFFVETK